MQGIHGYFDMAIGIASVFPSALFGGNDPTLIGINGNRGVSEVIEVPEI
jgi:hypothetical protein